MSTLIHRRIARDLGPAPQRGPGASLDALSWVGWASAVAAFGFLVFGLRPLTELGGPQTWDWNQVADTALRTVRSAAVVALPAALEWGVPGARRATPWLMRGTLLLALEEALRPALRFAQDQYFEQVAEAFDVGFDTPVGLALVLVSVAVSLLGIAGAWALSDGLADAGARSRRAVRVGVVAAGTALSMAAYLPAYGFFGPGAVFETGKVLWWLNLAGLALGFVDIAVWLLVGVRLVGGLLAWPRLHPRRAWILGAIAGACVLGYRFLAPLLFLAVPGAVELGWGLRLVSDATWILLLLALAAGLGRGRERREGRPRRVRLFVLNPTD